MEQQHIIQSQILDISYQQRNDTMVEQNKLASIYYHNLLPVIEKVFDRHVDHANILRIDRLELNLGLMTYPVDSEQFIVGFEKMLEEKIGFLIKNHKKNKSVEYIDRQDVNIKTDILKSILEKGILPWYVQERKKFKMDELFGELLMDNPSEFEKFLKSLSSAPIVVKRLLNYLHPAQIKILTAVLEKKITYEQLQQAREISHLIPKISVKALQKSLALDEVYFLLVFQLYYQEIKNQGKVFSYTVWLNQILPANRLYQWIYENYIEKNIDLPAENQPHSLQVESLRKFVTNQMNFFFSEMKMENEIIKNQIISQVFDLVMDKKPLLPVSEKTNKKNKRSNVNSNDLNEKVNNPVNKQNWNEANSNSFHSGDAPEKTLEHSEKISNETDVEKQKLGIENAGLIILNPFISTLFSHCGFLLNNEFKSKAIQQRAVFLLNYLVYGEDYKMPEYMLNLNKICCGLSFNEALDYQVVLSEDEKKYAHELLLAVINHWNVLQGTSVAGLQESFLQRYGILNINTEKVFLSVERKTIDILLDKIPWTISAVKFPWITKIIYTEW